jgi:hypothetical protein
MPVLTVSTEKLEKLFLPSTEKAANEEDKAWVVMDVSPLLTGDTAAVESDAKNAGEATMYMLAARIKEWNFTEQDGTPIDVNFESMKRLQLTDFTFLQNKLETGEGALTDDEKKESSATLSPSASAPAPAATPGQIKIVDGNSQ